MAASPNQQWIFASHPEGTIKDTDWKLTECEEPKVGDSDILLQCDIISVDPYMRGRMSQGKSYSEGWKVGETGTGFVVAKVLKGAGDYKEGDVVMGSFPWTKRFVVSAEASKKMLMMKLDVSEKLTAADFMAACGMPAWTAALSLKHLGNCKKGQVAFVSGAAGAVGLIVCQLLKNVYECTVIGSAGSDEKVGYLKSIGVDHAFNYKTADMSAELTKAAPEGLNLYYDNVGGPTLETAIDHMATMGVIICCGAISQYNKPKEEHYGPKNLVQIVGKQLRIEGFIVMRWASEMAATAGELAKFVIEGKIQSKYTIVEGFAGVLPALQGLFEGKNIGKYLVQC